MTPYGKLFIASVEEVRKARHSIPCTDPHYVREFEVKVVGKSIEQALSKQEVEESTIVCRTGSWRRMLVTQPLCQVYSLLGCHLSGG